MRILVNSIGDVRPLCQELLSRPGLEVSGLLPRVADLGDLGRGRIQGTGREGYPLYVCPAFPGQPYPYSLYLANLGLVLRETAPEAVLCIGEPSELGIAQVLATARRQRPDARLVGYAYENLVRHWQSFPQWLRGRAQRRSLRLLDRIACASHGAVEALDRAGFDAERCEVIYPGVDPEVFYPREEEQLRAELGAPEHFLIGYVGRLVPEKGVDTLLQTLERLPGRFRLCIAGAGPLREPLMARADRLGLTDRCLWLGGLAADAVARHLSAFDALVVPSHTLPHWQEQYPRVLVEAMFCGTSVVGSHTGAIPEIIGERGCTFPAGDAAALADCLLRLDDEVWRDDLADQARLRALEMFSMEQYIDGLLRLLGAG